MPDMSQEPMLPLGGTDVVLRVRYRNWRGEVRDRTIQPRKLWFGTTEWHPDPQWLLSALDVEKQAMRAFAMRDFQAVTCEVARQDAVRGAGR